MVGEGCLLICTPSSMVCYYFLKGKKWHLLSFSFHCSSWIRTLVFCLSVFLCVCVHIHCLLVSWVWHFSYLFCEFLHMETIDVFLIYCKHFLFINIFLILSISFLDSSFFGFCETDLQGASKSSGMLFLILFEFTVYIYLLLPHSKRLKK